MTGFRDLLAQTREQITEIEPVAAEDLLTDATFLDVRELDEFEQGTIPGALFIPRGQLETQIENRISRKKMNDSCKFTISMKNNVNDML